MSKSNNTLKRKKNHYYHLKESDHFKIQALFSQKNKNGQKLFNNSYIANYLGFHRSTISR